MRALQAARSGAALRDAPFLSGTVSHRRPSAHRSTAAPAHRRPAHGWAKPRAPTHRRNFASRNPPSGLLAEAAARFRGEVPRRADAVSRFAQREQPLNPPWQGQTPVMGRLKVAGIAIPERYACCVRARRLALFQSRSALPECKRSTARELHASRNLRRHWMQAGFKAACDRSSPIGKPRLL